MAKKKKAEDVVEVTVKAPVRRFTLLIDRGTTHRPQWETMEWDGTIQVEGGVLILMRDKVVVEAFSVGAWKTIKGQN